MYTRFIRYLYKRAIIIMNGHCSDNDDKQKRGSGHCTD